MLLHYPTWQESKREQLKVKLKTGNAIAAVNGSATRKTNENHRNFFLLKFMHGARVGFQVHHHNTNQIKTRKEPAHKSVFTADFGDLKCDIKAMTPKVLGFMSTCF